jgi:hypothetical protein
LRIHFIVNSSHLRIHFIVNPSGREGGRNIAFRKKSKGKKEDWKLGKHDVSVDGTHRQGRIVWTSTLGLQHTQP